jgi:polysaccharide chain length determinant protein (PEP-CTERM system associated)
MQELFLQIVGIARGMWKFRWPALIATWVVAVVGVVIVWRIPDQYEASARIFVDTDSILKPLMSGLAVQPNVEQQITMLSRTLISRPNLEKLVRMADLDLKEQGKGDIEVLIEKLMSRIEIRTAGGVNLYAMAYRDSEPEKAKRVIQSLVSIFIESGLGASRKDTDSAKTFLNEQIKVFEGKLEEAEARLKEFRLRNIERQGAEGKDSATRLGEIGSLLDAARLQLREAERARDAARRQLDESRTQTSSAAVSSLIRESSITVATQELDNRIDAQKRNLDSLLQRYTEQHPDVVGARRLIADLEEQRKKEIAEGQKRAAQNAAYAPNSAAGPSQTLAQQELARMLATSEVQVAGLHARVDEYAGRMQQVREQMKTAPQIEAEASQLNRDYAVTKKNYEDLVQRRQSAVMSGELDVASGVADFRLIDPPRVSPKPVSPNRLLLYPAALIAALAAGLGFAFSASQLRPTFQDGVDLRMKTGLPLLGVVTLLTTEADRQRERMSMLRFAGASGGLMVMMVGGLVTLLMLSR